MAYREVGGFEDAWDTVVSKVGDAMWSNNILDGELNFSDRHVGLRIECSSQCRVEH